MYVKCVQWKLFPGYTRLHTLMSDAPFTCCSLSCAPRKFRAPYTPVFPRSCDPCSRKIREPASFILHGSARTSTARHSFACTCLFVLLTYLSVREKLAHACMDTRSSSDHGAAAAWRALLTMVLQPIHWSARHARPTTHNPATQSTARRPPA